MNCPNCGKKITSRRRRCEVCGQDISAFDTIRKLSNRLYNEGLNMVRGRNLSGAIVVLKKSLEVNKENIPARNLLGLVYFEMGNTIEAISEWVISTNLSVEDDTADRLLNELQSDKNQFDELTQAAKKYNIALEQLQHDQEDIAIMQLKKVIGLNPKHIKAMLLLSLIYIKNSEFERAKKILKAIFKIDVGNPDARRYMEHIREIQEEKKGFSKSILSEELDGMAEIQTASRSKIYGDDKPNFVAFLTFFGGILLGIIVIYFLAVPNMKTKLNSEFSEKERLLGAQVSGLKSTITSLETENRNLKADKEELSSKLMVTQNSEAAYKALVEELTAQLEELNVNIDESTEDEEKSEDENKEDSQGNN